MNIDEKLRKFSTAILENTQKECEKSLEEYKKKLDDYYEEHKAEALKRIEIEQKSEADSIKKKAGKDFTNEQLQIRRKISRKQIELKNRLFDEVKELLEEFFKTPDYVELIKKQIHEAKRVARGGKINIYIDARDEMIFDELQRIYKGELIMDGRTFLGGIRAEIPEKNILIDNSFESKLEDWVEKYSIKHD